MSDYENYIRQKECQRHRAYESIELAKRAKVFLQREHKKTIGIWICSVCQKLHLATVKKGTNFTYMNQLEEKVVEDICLPQMNKALSGLINLWNEISRNVDIKEKYSESFSKVNSQFSGINEWLISLSKNKKG